MIVNNLYRRISFVMFALIQTWSDSYSFFTPCLSDWIQIVPETALQLGKRCIGVLLPCIVPRSCRCATVQLDVVFNDAVNGLPSRKYAFRIY